jgi:RNA polymerase sigma-70 factor (ECF subfamily)
VTSFGLLYERHYRMAVGIARSRLADSHLAEDAAQEAFAIAYRTLSTLRNGKRFTQWLGTICRRTASRIDSGRPPHSALAENTERAGDSDLQRLRLQVQDALQVLSEASREIVILHYFSGLSYEEIAQALGLSVQSVHGRLQRARMKLAQILTVHDSSGAKT